MVLKKNIIRSFKIHGLALQTTALDKVLHEINNDPSVTVEDIIYAVKNSVEKSKVSSSIISLNTIEIALESLLQVSEENNYQKILVFDAFSTPSLKYIPTKNCFELIDPPSSSGGKAFFADAENKIQRARQRFSIVEQKVRRNELFRPSLVPCKEKKETYIKLSNIESLAGSSEGKKQLIGILGLDERKRPYLEDSTSRIYLDLSNVTATIGLYTPNCIVLVEGYVRDDIFFANTIGHPVPERREESLKALGDIDHLGINLSRNQREKIHMLAESDSTSVFVLLSDVHLDDPQVLTKLEVLFDGFEPAPPPVILLLGNFTSKPIGQGANSYGIMDLADYFDSLGALIQKYPNLMEHSKFILVPGPQDPGSPNILPRHPLPKICTRGLISRVPNAVFTTNPCRIMYYDREIVVFREDLLQKMRRHCMVSKMTKDEKIDSEEKTDLSEKLVKTIIDQAHLCPLPMSVRPIYWSYDASLQLFPSPNVLILADKNEQYQWEYQSSCIINPGPFSTDYSFVVFCPGTNQTEFSTVE